MVLVDCEFDSQSSPTKTIKLLVFAYLRAEMSIICGLAPVSLHYKNKIQLIILV
jgi:hypothetical protein